MPRSTQEMLYDSEAALRLVARALAEIRGTGAHSVAEEILDAEPKPHAAPGDGPEINELQEALSRASLEMTERFLQVSGMLAELERRLDHAESSAHSEE